MICYMKTEELWSPDESNRPLWQSLEVFSEEGLRGGVSEGAGWGVHAQQ